MVDKLVMFWTSTGLAQISFGPLFMIGLSCVLFYLAIVKEYEPLLLIPIGFGMLLVNLPATGIIAAPVKGILGTEPGGLLYYLNQGVELGIICDVLKTAANDVYVIKPHPGITHHKEVLIPVIDSVVLEIDLENQIVTVDLPDGLLE